MFHRLIGQLAGLALVLLIVTPVAAHHPPYGQPTPTPVVEPTAAPTATPEPTATPTEAPTPTVAPTHTPTATLERPCQMDGIPHASNAASPPNDEAIFCPTDKPNRPNITLPPTSTATTMPVEFSDDAQLIIVLVGIGITAFAFFVTALRLRRSGR